MPKINAAGLRLIQQWEGCRLTAYRDPVGIWTIGYGHTPATEGQTLTQQAADELLSKDLEVFEEGVQKLCDLPITPNQFSALVSFAYNLGVEALAGSTLMRLVNAGNFKEAAFQFSRWVYADGEKLPGLVNRRGAEAKLFLAVG